MSIDVTGAYVYFVIPIFGGIPVTQTMVSWLFVTAILCFACIYGNGCNLKLVAVRTGRIRVFSDAKLILNHINHSLYFILVKSYSRAKSNYQRQKKNEYAS